MAGSSEGIGLEVAQLSREQRLRLLQRLVDSRQVLEQVPSQTHPREKVRLVRLAQVELFSDPPLHLLQALPV